MPAGIGYPDGSVSFSLPANQPNVDKGYTTIRERWDKGQTALRDRWGKGLDYMQPFPWVPSEHGGGAIWRNSQNVHSGTIAPDERPEEVFAPLIQNTPPQMGQRVQRRRDNDLTSFLSRVR